ncbi:MAG: hypothetical protein KGN00_05560 [Chloroflexota bacterium]|nr:hypothetical protein [Chloroflexota bacterium]MDE3193136.1 hypothetical protein [Chloroflexota bacterium]
MQAGKTSPWAGMGHEIQKWSTWRLAPGAAMLEVTIDPAAHGDDAVGPLSRGVYLMTSAGKELDFELKATLTH